MAEPIAANGASSAHAHELQTLSAATVSKFDGENFVKVPPLDFSFENIKYEVTIPASGLPCFRKEPPKVKTILHGLSGIVAAGESLAILGSSGAGKSTLLDILASRVKRRAFSGTMKVNGDEDIKKFKHLIAYVPQADTLFPHLTVEESLLYSARLRLPRSMSEQERLTRVRKVIEILGLTKCKDTQVGNDQGVRGVSGGERRRTSIGMELVTAPSLIFLDEPTSGLDSFSALNVTEILSALTHQGRTIILTIHQPSSTIFRSFDKVLFLSEGQIIYYGPPMKAIEYFSRIGFDMPANTNPADFILEVTNLKVAKGELPALTTPWNTEGQKFIASLPPSKPPQNAQITLKRKRSDRARFGWQLLCLLRRNVLNYTRNPALFFQFVGNYIVVALVLGTCFWMTAEKKTEKAALYSVGFFSFFTATYTFTQLASLPAFLEEKEIFRRERGSGYFTVLPYCMSLLLVQLPLLAILAFLGSIVGYWLVGMPPDVGAFFFFFFVLFITLFAAQSFAMMLSALVPNFGAGNAVASAMFAFMFVFSGTFIRRPAIPKGWIWFHYLSQFKYGIDAHSQNLFLNSHSGPYLRNRCSDERFNVSSDPTCYFTGYEYLDELGMLTSLDKWADMGLLLSLALIYRVAFYLLLRFKHTPQRG